MSILCLSVCYIERFVCVSLGGPGERWVWGHERSGRQIDPTFPQTGGSSLLQTSSASSLSPLRRPARTEGSFSVPSTRVLDGSLSLSQPQASLSQSIQASSLSQSQAPLVIRPLPIDISTLPLETSDSSDTLEITHGRLFEPTLQHQFPQHLGSADLQGNPSAQFSVLDFSRPHVNPSFSSSSLNRAPHTPQAGHLEALVSTPDISQLPLQSTTSSFDSPSLPSFASPFSLSSSSSFVSPSLSSSSPSSFASPSLSSSSSSSSSFPSPSFLSVSFPSSSPASTSSYSFVSPGNAIPVGSDVLFPQKIDTSDMIRPGPQPVPLPLPQPLPTTPPPSSTPLPVQVFLPRLDNSNFLNGDGDQERQLFKTLEALQKEYLTLNSRQLDEAFQILSNQLAAGINDIPDGVADSLVFPVISKEPTISVRNPSLAEENTQFKPTFEASNTSPVFTFPLFQQDFPQHLQLSPLGPLLHRRTQQPVGVRIGRSESNTRKERRSPSYMWVWPDN
ncbi:hypothetical protein Pcinc_041234 [Petrolisthes cinctipes]|uniref:Uncharacterized protein n=1 Tax=Petrolisthes cinctipes TaxID=88211 RepID=A0AAE1BL83_PETCI|nr:hypothetical protein Pcinc_041234 [Petrolisthes cinctipes]